MGNLYAESGIESAIYEHAYKSKIGCSAQELCNRINNGQYSKDKFCHDAVGFGLAQWTFHTRKEALYNSCHGQICSMHCQLEYLHHELTNSYKGVWNELKSCSHIRGCSDTVMVKFENPRDKSEGAKARRAGYGQKYYNEFAHGGHTSVKPPSSSTHPPSHKTYTVKSGDNLSKIASQFHTTVARLAACNNIKNVNKIYVGQVLTIC